MPNQKDVVRYFDLASARRKIQKDMIDANEIVLRIIMKYQLTIYIQRTYEQKILMIKRVR